VIIFQNPGLIDMAVVTTMGVSVKDGDEVIGFFGTGLKFSIATILRDGGSVTIWRGLEAHVLGTEKGEVRGEEFDFVTLDGQRIGFTTNLGRTWKPWMAFRELASNCRDENGRYWQIGEAEIAEIPVEGMTTIVAVGLDEVWPDRTSIMLESKPLAAAESIEIHEGITPYVFYRGVRIHTSSRPFSHTYNILGQIELTEDRTAKNWYQVEQRIERGIGALEERPMLRRILTCGEMFSEHHMDVPAYGSPGPVFRDLARELAMGGATVKNANPKAVSMARASVVQDMTPGDSIELDPVQDLMLGKATAILSGAGFQVNEFPIIVLDTLGPNICGMAKDGKIFLSRMPFQKGTREVAATLLEEYAHLKSGEGDASLGFQNWLFDQLLVQAEKAAGEPF